MRSTAITLCILLTASRAFAALAWEHTTLQVDASPLEDEIEAEFRFTNTGAQPVTITETHATCGCTVPTLDKRTFAPGEAGTVRVLFTIGEGTIGKQQKSITVQTDVSPTDAHVLTLSVNVPALWDVQPRFVRWDHGEALSAKTITIRALHPDLARPVGVEARDARFAVAMDESADERGLFVITITPEQTDAPMFTSVLITTNAPTEKKRTVQLYAVVR